MLPLTTAPCNQLIYENAKNPETTGENLRELAVHSDAKIRAAVANNPNTPIEILLQLGAEFPVQLIANPAFSLPLLLLEQSNLQKIVPAATLLSLLKQASLPPEFVKWAASHCSTWGEQVSTLIVQHRHSTKQILETVAAGISNASAYSQELGMAILQHQAITEDILFCLASHSQKEYVLMAIAEHPLRSQRVLQQLAEKGYSRKLTDVLIGQPDIPDLALEKLSNHIPDRVALHPNASGKTLTDLVFNLNQPRHHELRLLAISRPDFPASTLEQLASNQKQYFVNHEMRLAIAKHPNTPLPVLEQFVHNDSIEPPNKHALILEAVASRPDLPTALIVKLAQSTGQQALVKNPSIPPESLLELANHSDISVRNMIAKHPNTPTAILEQWVNHPILARVIVENPHAPSWILEQFAEMEAVHPALAKNPATPGNVLRVIALYWDGSINSDVLRMVGNHPNTPADLLAKWVQSQSWLWRFIAANPKAPIDLLFRLKQLSNDRHTEVDIALAQNPRSPNQLLEQFFERHGGTIAQRPNLSNRLLKKLLNSSNIGHRQRLAQNPHIPPQYLHQLAKESDRTIQKNIVENPSTPIDLLQQLSSSQDPYIADMAMRQSWLRTTMAKCQ